MGSDGLPHSRSALIALTTVVQPMKDMAERSFSRRWIAIGHGDTQRGAQFGRSVPSGGDGNVDQTDVAGAQDPAARVRTIFVLHV